MRKFLYNKGFTLVELIVTIAIIGVLAAILVPTLIGFSVSADVTSVNATAGEIKNIFDKFFTDADANDTYYMLKGDSNREVFTVEVKDKTWTVKAVTNTSAFKDANGYSWGTDGSGTASDDIISASCAEEILAIHFATIFPEMENAVIKANCIGGKCVSLWYTPDANDASSVTDIPEFGTTYITPWVDENGNEITVFSWDNNNAGITKNGLTVGTAPILPLG